jgi:acetyl-CoA carboxylase biotin carboxyl carrier protein
VSQLKPGDIEEIIRQFEASELATLEVRVGDSELFLSRYPGGQPSWAGQEAPGAPAGAQATPPPAATGAAPAEAATPLEVPAGHVAVTAPSMGTFYRAEKPGAAPYVEVGQEVAPETELGLVEVMKLFTTVRAGVRGRVAQILVADGTPIALGQPLFLLEVHE